MNIHEALTAQQVHSELGPLEITGSFEKRNPKAPAFLKVKDQAGGETALKIWGPAGNSQFSQGQVITVIPDGPKAEIRADKDQQGRDFLNVNNCRISFGGAPVASSPGGHPASTQLAAAGGQSARPPSAGSFISTKDEQIIRQNSLAHATALVVAGGVDDPKAAARLVLDIAPWFAAYSLTGEDITANEIPM